MLLLIGLFRCIAQNHDKYQIFGVQLMLVITTEASQLLICKLLTFYNPPIVMISVIP